ncbi:MAG: hypothetical protein RR998_10070 [Oscillospiraceae bacterium]
MDDVIISRLVESELSAFREFCLAAWGEFHPLVHDERMFDVYYRRADGLDFVCAQDGKTGEFLSVCGYIKTNSSARPDIWISFLVSKKGAPFGLSYRLFDFIIDLTAARSIGCNNIRKKTSGLYTFRGWTFGALTQYYRLNGEFDSYTLCNIYHKDIPAVVGTSICASPVCTREELLCFEDPVFSKNKPYKDVDYIAARYLDYPWFTYKLVGLSDGESPLALVVYRIVNAGGVRVLRVVDYIGDREALPAAGRYLDGQMRELRAEFCDWYAAGLSDCDMLRAGFIPRTLDDCNVIPNYLEPPLIKNVDFFYFTSDPDGYAVFKADGDQDRPNLISPEALK